MVQVNDPDSRKVLLMVHIKTTSALLHDYIILNNSILHYQRLRYWLFVLILLYGCTQKRNTLFSAVPSEKTGLILLTAYLIPTRLISLIISTITMGAVLQSLILIMMGLLISILLRTGKAINFT